MKTKLRLNDHKLLTSGVLESLHRFSIFTVADILASNFDNLIKENDFSLKLLCTLRDHYLSTIFLQRTNGLNEYEEVVHKYFIVSTTCAAFDNMVEGGFHSQEITMLIGEHTCIDHLLATIQSNVPMVYLQTGGQFEFLENNSQAATHLNISDIFEFFDVVEELSNEKNKYRVLVISCLKEILKPLFSPGLKLELSSKIKEAFRCVRRICQQNIVCLICTCDDKGVSNWRDTLCRQADNVLELTGQSLVQVTVVKSNKISNRENKNYIIF